MEQSPERPEGCPARASPVLFAGRPWLAAGCIAPICPHSGVFSLVVTSSPSAHICLPASVSPLYEGTCGMRLGLILVTSSELDELCKDRISKSGHTLVAGASNGNGGTPGAACNRPRPPAALPPAPVSLGSSPTAPPGPANSVSEGPILTPPPAGLLPPDWPALGLRRDRPHHRSGARRGAPYVSLCRTPRSGYVVILDPVE